MALCLLFPLLVWSPLIPFLLNSLVCMGYPAHLSGLAQKAFLIGRPSEVPIFKARNSLFCITLVGEDQECAFRSLAAWI